jgi:hypothetical protein
VAYDIIDQSIMASCLIQGRTNDSFFFPTGQNQHTGYAFNGLHYTLGVPDTAATFAGNLLASWWTEAQSGNPDRGDQRNFPTYGLVLLSAEAMVILDQATPVALAAELPMWMVFVLENTNALANNFNGAIQGFIPSGVCYADGIISVSYVPNSGNQRSYNPAGSPAVASPIIQPYPAPYPIVAVNSNMVVNIDFAQDTAYLDVAA